jgi:type II secretory pathway pseudopilin PulG
MQTTMAKSFTTSLRRPARQRGFTYIVMLLAAALLGTLASRLAAAWSTDAKREREQQLLAVGAEFRVAIASYYQATPGPQKRLPESLDVLLSDDRFPKPMRHLRQIYVDPLTGKADWQLVLAPGGGVLGVHSASREVPLKRTGFQPAELAFEKAESFQDWQFVFVPPYLAGQVGALKAKGVQVSPSGSGRP